MPALLIMKGERLAYVKEQVGHSSIQITVALYGHLVPGLNKGAVHALAEATKCNLGATEAEVDSLEDSQVVEEFGGPCRGRTYGPLIKSPPETLPQDTQQEESAAKVEDS